MVVCAKEDNSHHILYASLLFLCEIYIRYWKADACTPAGLGRSDSWSSANIISVNNIFHVSNWNCKVFLSFIRYHFEFPSKPPVFVQYPSICISNFRMMNRNAVSGSNCQVAHSLSSLGSSGIDIQWVTSSPIS